jgi:hypothetical protein
MLFLSEKLLALLGTITASSQVPLSPPKSKHNSDKMLISGINVSRLEQGKVNQEICLCVNSALEVFL